MTVEEAIGPYQILKPIAKGGMGEVFLVYDPVCRRNIALKRARSDLKNKDVLFGRFLREARLTATLTHPSIIPIYHIDRENLYYTMPYIEGKTLKNLLKEKIPVPGLIRPFYNLCQAIAYAHEQEIVHRDIKPENVMVGKYGEAYVLDWGLAKKLDEPEEEGEENGDETTTVPGKVFGTVAYMAPERALGHPATVLSDIYSLGMVLYEILSLHRPFKRGNLKEFRKTLHQERWIEPASLAPYRNVSRMLATIAHKCLHPRMSDRYQSVRELINEIEYYLEGRSEWFEIASLHTRRQADWEFQENVYLPNQIGDWVGMMVSKDSYPGNVRLTTRIKLGCDGRGIGLLVNIPEEKKPGSGYCLLLGPDGARLFRSSIEVAKDPELHLIPGTWHTLRIEKVESSLHFYLDGHHRLSYISHLPLPGTHIGLLYQDAEYEVDELTVAVGSYSIRVNCLAVPDAFLATKSYDKALAEYRRIAYSFPERDEGREAQFRAGITLLEQAKQGDEKCFQLALDEFAKLHKTPGAPLEYLGKAVVYKTLKENEEEVKCFEMAFRKYPHHPLLHMLKEEVIFRLHASQATRLPLYRFLLIVIQYMADAWEDEQTQKIVQELDMPHDRYALGSHLAYLLARPHTVEEFGKHTDVSRYLAELGLKTIDDPIFLAETFLRTNQPEKVLALDVPDTYKVWALLLRDQWQEAGQILEPYALEDVVVPDTLLHIVYGCYLAHTEGEEIAYVHFLAASDTPHPTRWELLGHYLTGKITEDLELMSERRDLYRQAHLYFHCLGNIKQANHFSSLEKKQYATP